MLAWTVSFAAVLWILTGYVRSSQAAGPSGRDVGQQKSDIPWILASDEQPWSLALAAPVAAHFRRTGPCPLVMAISNPPTREAEWLLSLAPGQPPIVLATSKTMKLGAALKKRGPEVLQIGSDPVAGSAKVARRFWSRCREVVIAIADNPEAVILGSALAAGRDKPILLCGREKAAPSPPLSRTWQPSDWWWP